MAITALSSVETVSPNSLKTVLSGLAESGPDRKDWEHVKTTTQVLFICSQSFTNPLHPHGKRHVKDMRSPLANLLVLPTLCYLLVGADQGGAAMEISAEYLGWFYMACGSYILTKFFWS
jgi:hypothetical protein